MGNAKNIICREPEYLESAKNCPIKILTPYARVKALIFDLGEEFDSVQPFDETPLVDKKNLSAYLKRNNIPELSLLVVDRRKDSYNRIDELVCKNQIPAKVSYAPSKDVACYQIKRCEAASKPFDGILMTYTGQEDGCFIRRVNKNLLVLTNNLVETIDKLEKQKVNFTKPGMTLSIANGSFLTRLDVISNFLNDIVHPKNYS
jgi:hypothetical protein